MSTTLTPTRRAGSGRPQEGTRPRTRGDRPTRTTAAPRSRPVAATAPPRSSRAPRAPFVLLVVGLLAGGLVSLLLLNTVLAEDAFALNDLRKRTAALEQREQALRQDVARAEAPDALARKAQALGMVPAPGSAFVDLGRGKVVGRPAAAAARSDRTRADDEPEQQPEQGPEQGRNDTPAPNASRSSPGPAEDAR